MPQIVEIRTADDPRDVIHRACQLLAEGQLVAFPTETAYVVAAGSLSEPGVQRLRTLSSGQAVLALKSPEEAHDYLPNMPATALTASKVATCASHGGPMMSPAP